MSSDEQSGLLLGQQTPPATVYAPQLLFPIPRAQGRATLGDHLASTMYGADIWHAYELSWLDATGRPMAKIARFTVPAESPNIVESKSFKLYLNSLNSHAFDSANALQNTLESDLSAVAGAAVKVEICDVDDAEVAPEALEASCIDDAPLGVIPERPEPSALRVNADQLVKESLCTHLLRSLCPVTGQPDWASVRIRYEGPAIDRAGLLAYVLGFRNHQEFHEQCVERMFSDLQRTCSPVSLTIQAFYTRRGGLDINPLRSTEKHPMPGPRLLRQ
ncbi:MAG: NADPH-dependent 7-cyano-7-deazaguanine reductase QueF [Halioglobus sp.]